MPLKNSQCQRKNKLIECEILNELNNKDEDNSPKTLNNKSLCVWKKKSKNLYKFKFSGKSKGG